MRVAWILGVLVWALAVWSAWPEDAKCSACIGQYCAFNTDCPSGCACAKPPYEPTGECW